MMASIYLNRDFHSLNLDDHNHGATSPQSANYNCVAWVIGEPGDDPTDAYWLPGVLKEDDLSAFMAVFAIHGYVGCPDKSLESGFDNIAVYTDFHACRHANRRRPLDEQDG